MGSERSRDDSGSNGDGAAESDEHDVGNDGPVRCDRPFADTASPSPLLLPSATTATTGDSSSSSGNMAASRNRRDEQRSDGLQENVSERRRSLPLSDTNIPLLCCAFLASITTGGTTYAFGSYGNALRDALHLNEAQLATISSSNFCAGLLSWIPGLLVDRFGTRFGITCGGLLGAVALMNYYSIAANNMLIDTNNKELVVVVLSALGVTIFLSCALVTGSVFKIIVGSCGPGSKGSAVGVAKGYVGLGSGAYLCLFQSIRSPQSSDLDFLPMAATLFILAASIPSFFVLPSHSTDAHSPSSSSTIAPKRRDVSSPLHFRVLYASLLALATIVVASALATLNEDKKNGHRSRIESTSQSSLEIIPASVVVVVDDDGQEIQHTDTRNIPLAVLLVVVWVLPVVSLLFLPQNGHSDQETNEVDAADGEEQNALIDRIDEQFPQQQDATESKAQVTGDPDLAELLQTIEPQRSVREKNTNHDILMSQRNDEPRSAVSKSLGAADETGLQSTNGGRGDHTEREEQRQLHSLFEGTGDSGGDSDDEDSDDPDKNLLQMLGTASAWLMLWTTTILVGAGTVETNNLGQMVESLEFPSIIASAGLAIFSVTQAAGRVTTGALSEAALDWNTRSCCIAKGVPRPLFLAIAGVVSLVAHLILAVANTEASFVIGTAVSGYAFGMSWPLMVLIVGEVFGTAHVAANYMFYDGFTSAAGTFLLSKIVAQRVYEAHVDSDTEDGSSDETPCYGEACFGPTHLIISALSLTCIGTSLLLMYISRNVYDRRSLHRH